MKARLIVAAAAVALQVAVLGFMAGQREFVLRNGQPILLRTAPIDPNDPMRGNYARFTYDISSVPRSFWRGGLKGKFDAKDYNYQQGRDLRVFAALQLSESGVAELVSLSDEAPSGGLFLQGRVDRHDGTRLNVRYGIEAMFMEQGKSQKLEDTRRVERPGAPIDAEVSVNGSGLAVLKGYHWEPLGITASFERETTPAPVVRNNAPRPSLPRQFVRAVKIELKNYGPEEVAIVDLPDAGSLRLVPDFRGQVEPHYRWSGEARVVARPAAAHVIVLKPGQSHVMRIDLMQPEWFVVDTKAPNSAPISLRDVTDPSAAMFRIEYAPPSQADSAGLPNAPLISRGRLLSRAFNATSNVD